MSKEFKLTPEDLENLEKDEISPELKKKLEILKKIIKEKL